MPFGILEPSQHQDQVPGTVKLLQQDQTHVELNPKPSNSPNDPLRWSQSKKFALLLTVSIGCALSGIQGTILAVATFPILEELEITLLQTESFTAYPFLAIAVGCTLSAIFARVIGKRPVYLVAAVLCLAGTIWNAVATSYGSFVGARIIYGLGAGTFESMALAIVGDIYYVHQRGRAMGFFSFMALGCTQIAPVLGGWQTDHDGWRSIFYTLIAFWAALLIMVIVFVPETTFIRASKYETDMLVDKASMSSSDIGSQHSVEAGVKPEAVEHVDDTVDSTEPRRSFAQQMAPFRRIHSGVSLWAATVMYFITGLYPIVWFAFILLGSYLAWYLGINVTLAQIFAAPPIGFGPTQLGYINTFGLPGALVAECVLHAFADSSCRWLARRNNNIHEPEFRLFMIIPAIIVAAIAYPLYGWYAGVVALQQEISWVAASVLFGMAVFCLVQAQSVAFAYLLDSHREISIEAGMFAVMLRSFFTYGATTFVPLWLETSGIANAFYAMAGLQAGLAILATGLMYVFGKKVRAFMHRHSPVRRFQSVTGQHH